MLKLDLIADAIMSTMIGIAVTTGVMTEIVETAAGTEKGIANETGNRLHVEAIEIVIGGGAVRGRGLATGAAIGAETEALGGARLVIGIGLRGGADAIDLPQDLGRINFVSHKRRKL